MLINNKISRTTYGPYLFFGYTAIVVGAGAAYNGSWILAIIAVIITWFILASYSGIEINTNNQQFREFNMWFGILKTGKWKPIDGFIGITLVSMHEVSRIFSLTSKSKYVDNRNFRIYLVNQSKRPEIVIQKFKNKEDAQRRLDEFSIWLHLPVYSVKA